MLPELGDATLNVRYYVNYWVLQSISMALTILLLPKLRVTGILAPLLMSIGLALVNTFIWDAALFFEIPDALSTRAVVLFLANGAIFWLLVKILPSVEIDGFATALIAPVVLSVCSLFVGTYLAHLDWVELAEVAYRKVVGMKEVLEETRPGGVPARTGER